MKRLVLTSLAFAVAVIASAQFKRIEVEEVDNQGKVPGTTYRVYAVLEHSEDHIHAIYGDQDNVLKIECTAPIYQHPEGGSLSRDIIRKSVNEDEKLRYDSWFTLGLEDNYVNLMTQFGLDANLADFEAGNGFSSTNGMWYATPDAAQVYARKQTRVLIMQITTEGKFTATLNLQGRTVGMSEGGTKLETNAAKLAEQERLRNEIQQLKTEVDKLEAQMAENKKNGKHDANKALRETKAAKDKTLAAKREAFKNTNGVLWKETGVTFTCG